MTGVVLRYCVSPSVPKGLRFSARILLCCRTFGTGVRCCVLSCTSPGRKSECPGDRVSGVFFSDFHSGRATFHLAFHLAFHFSTWNAPTRSRGLHSIPTPLKGGGIGMGARRKKVSTAKKALKTADWIDHSGPPAAGRGMWQSVTRRTTPRPGLHLLLCSRLHPVTNRGGAVSPHTRAETCAKTPLPVTNRWVCL